MGHNAGSGGPTAKGMAVIGAVWLLLACPPALAQDVEPVTPLLATADAAKGRAISKRCAACHLFVEGGPKRLGPPLWNVVGRPFGAVAGYNYSTALKKKAAQGAVWDFETLNAYLANPRAFLPGGSMVFVGLKRVQDRADLILYLRDQSSDPVPLPGSLE